MRRPNYDLQEVHERKRLGFDHLWVVLGAIEGLPAGFFKVLRYHEGGIKMYYTSLQNLALHKLWLVC